MLKIRKTTESDLYDVLHVEKEAFGNEKGPEIADLANGLLSDPSAMPRSIKAYEKKDSEIQI